MKVQESRAILKRIRPSAVLSYSILYEFATLMLTFFAQFTFHVAEPPQMSFTCAREGDLSAIAEASQRAEEQRPSTRVCSQTG